MRIIMIRIVILVVVVVLIALAGFTCVAWKARSDARDLLGLLRRMSSDSNPAADLELVKRDFGKKLERECRGSRCDYELTISNRPISWTHLLPYSEIKTYFSTSQGSLEFFHVIFRRDLHSGKSSAVHVQEDFSSGEEAVFFLNPHGRTNELLNGIVEFNRAATPEQKEAALAFSLNCLLKVRGCGSIANMSPRVWKVTATGTIYSRMPSQADAVGDTYAP
jgi:hypothetical protein